jgi:hypothetical protein
VRLSDGLGNRLFQLAALLGYAERWNLKPVLFPSQILGCNHADADKAHLLLPQLALEWNIAEWTKVTEEAADCASYKERTKPLGCEPVLLAGHFQTARYFPSTPIVLSFETVLSAERRAALDLHYRNFNCDWWIHIRLGDYMALPHYHIDIVRYLAKVIGLIPAGEKVLLFSDSPGEALRALEALSAEGATAAGVEWIAAPEGLGPIESLYMMSKVCGGCICSNSTFSWWGAYCSAARMGGGPIYFPGRWFNLPYPTADIYPSWGTVVTY